MFGLLKESHNEEKYLRFNIKLLQYLGLWPLHKGSKFVKILKYLIAFSVLFQLTLFYTTEIIHFYSYFGNIQIMTKVMCQITANTLLIYKIIFTLYNRKKFEKILDILICNLTKYVHRHSQQILIKEYNKRIKIFTIIYIIFGVIVISFWMIIPFIDHDSEDITLPFQSWTPFNISHPSLYITAYVIHGIHGSIFILYMPACGMFTFGLIYHGCAQFRILHYSLICLKIKSSNSVCENKKMNKNCKFMTDLRECIIHHQIILRYCTELEQILNPVMFVQLLTTGAAICVVSFQVTEDTLPHNQVSVYNFRFLTMAVFLISVLFECGIYFWVGEELITQSLRTADKVYEINEWYHSSVLIKRSIVIIMRQCQQPIKLTCGKLYVLSLENFANVVKTSYSFCTVLRTFQD